MNGWTGGGDRTSQASVAAKCGNDRGVSTLEFTFVLPFLLFAVLGIVELCRATLTLSLLQTAVREGARLSAVTSVETASNQGTTVVALGTQRLQDVLASGGVVADTMTVECRDAAGGAEVCSDSTPQTVRATAAVTFRTAVPVFLPSLSEFLLTRETSVRREGG
jgi:Flp pilus assembly protein TadG